MPHSPNNPHFERLKDALREVEKAIVKANKLRARINGRMRAVQVAREKLAAGKKRAAIAGRVLH